MKKSLSILLSLSLVLGAGLATIDCGGSSDECTSNADCAADEFCNLSTKKCEKEGCEPQCTGKCCGDDGCGNQCPDTCAAPNTCNATNCVCECVPNCTDRECGPDPTCGEICGTCEAGETCNDGTCETCVPDCTNRECGLDPVCNQSCGDCDPGYTCDNGTCVQGASVPGDPCPNGPSDCPDPWDVCLEGGGMTYCTSDCVTDADCGGEPNCCQDFGSGPYCWDETQCPGEGQPGDPCPFNDEVNADADACAIGLECLGLNADGNSGACPGGADAECTDIDSGWNADCVGGNCGASFCSAPCDDNDECEAGFFPQDVNNSCMCIPQPDAECTDPVNNVGCEEGFVCIEYQQTLVCVEEGTQERGDPCGQEEGYCKAGMSCISWWGADGPFLCHEYCDTTDDSGCSGECDACYEGDVAPWGNCYMLECCDMTEDDTVQCGTHPSGEETLCSLSNPDEDCTVACWPSGGLAAGEACEYDDCGPNLFCTFYFDMEAGPGVCVPRCDTSGEDCTEPDTCGHIDALQGCDDSWGVCMTD